MVVLMDESRPLTVSQVARRLERSATLVHTLLREGRLRGTRTPLGWLVEPQDLEAYEDARTSKRAARQANRDGNTAS